MDNRNKDIFKPDLRGVPESGPAGITQSYVEGVDALHADNDLVKVKDEPIKHDTDPSAINIPVEEKETPEDDVEVRVLGGAGLTGAELMPPENAPHNSESHEA